MQGKAHWFLDSGRIGLKSCGGELVPALAMDIFKSEFAQARTVGGYKVSRPSEELPSIQFSRFPAEPAIHLAFKDGNFLIDVGLKVLGDFVAHSGQTDQIIHKGYWIPVQSDMFLQLLSWIAEIPGFSNGRGTLASLVALRTRRDIPGLLIDEVRESSLSLAAGLRTNREDTRGLQGTLYPYQADGVRFLRMVAEQGVGCVLADEMGLGKTLQIIALLLEEKSKGRVPSLVVSPATLLENWRREIAKFAPGLTVQIHAGSNRPGVSQKLLMADTVVVSYETALQDEALLAGIQWNVVVLDEAQNIKNPLARRTQVVKRLPRRVSIAVTGTPLENHLDDLWSLGDFALPGLLGQLNQFRQEYAEEVGDASRLGRLMAPIVLRRRISDVANDLKEKIEIPQPLHMTRRLAEEYERIRLGALAEYGAEGNLVALVRLRMFCAHPSIISKWDFDPYFDMPKFIRLMEILEEVFSAHEKALIFSTYTAMADLFLKELPARFHGGFFRQIDGRVPVPDRQLIVDEFFSASSFGALILNPKAAGVGLNITAANHVIHYNPEWNPALTDQATARAFRNKQTRPVTVHYLYFLNTVEEVIVDRARFKRQLAGSAVTGHAGDVDPGAIVHALRISPIRGAQE